MWRRALLVAGRFTVGAAAFLFALVAAFVAVLGATGALDRDRAGQVATILRGRAEAVEVEELAGLRKAKEELERQRREAPEHTVALRVAEAEAERETRQGQASMSRQVLEFLGRELERRETEVDARIKRWETARRAFEAERLSREEQRRTEALSRVRKIIENFDPTEIARSYQQKYTTGGGDEAAKAKREVIDDFRMLREPFVTEILSAFEGPEAPRLRMEILEELKRPSS